MIRNEYFKVINNTYLVHKTKDKIKSVNDYTTIGELEIDNTKLELFTHFNLTFSHKFIKEKYEDKIKTRFRYDEIPKDFMIINEIGIRCREFDNVKYLDIAGDLLFEYSWCE